MSSGSDVAVFVHESGMSGLCGFWTYAVWLAQGRHLGAVLFDRCGYGASVCEKDSALAPVLWDLTVPARASPAAGGGFSWASSAAS